MRKKELIIKTNAQKSHFEPTKHHCPWQKYL